MTLESSPSGALTGPPRAALLNLKAGGVCLVAGSVVFAVVRVLHGDTPAADAEAALSFVQHRPIYPAVHAFAVLAALVTLFGQVMLSRSMKDVAASLLGQAALTSAVVGLAVFAVESTSEGLALPELADAASKADPSQRMEFVRAARAVAAVTHGPSLVAMALMIGIPVLLLGVAIVVDAYPTWLGWVGMAVGAVTSVAAVGLFLVPSLFPGFLLYGVLGSVVAQLWFAGVGISMLRRARG